MIIRRYHAIPENLFAIKIKEISATPTYGEVIATGALDADLHYEVVTTEADHFGAGVVVGDVVTGITTACDASNTVKQISDTVILGNGNTVTSADYGTYEANDMYLIESGSGYGNTTALGTFMTAEAFALAYQEY